VAAAVAHRAPAALGIGLPVLATLIVVVASGVTPGYDPATMTISRLAAPGAPAAFAVQTAIGLVALTCFLAAAAAPRAAARSALAAAGIAFVVTAAVRLDPSSATSTAVHRLFSGVAVAGLVVAALTYDRPSFVVGVAELAMLAIALGLLATSFNAWGAWERGLLVLPLGWMVLLSVRSLRTAVTAPRSEESTSASSEAVNSGGSYVPVRSVTRAKR
jgi:hypothetical protein